MLAGIKAFFDFSGSKQWQNYRDDLRAHHGPAVPLLGKWRNFCDNENVLEYLLLVTVKSDIIKIKAARELARNKYRPMSGINAPSGELVDIQMYKKLREIVRGNTYS